MVSPLKALAARTSHETGDTSFSHRQVPAWTDHEIMRDELNNTGQYVRNVYRYDRLSNTISLVTHSVAGNQSADGSSGISDVSPDGDAILIGSLASDLTHDTLPETGNGTSYLYLYEAASDTMTLVSLNEAGQPYHTQQSVFSPDSNLIYYEIGQDDTDITMKRTPTIG